MTALIVGGDYIKQLERIIADRGVRRIEHWTGRKTGDLRRTVPKGTGLVVLLCDYLSHSLARKIKTDAERLGLPVLYCRRSLGQFSAKLDELLESGAVVIGGAADGACCGLCEAKIGLAN